MVDLVKLVFDRKHLRDVRNWVLAVLVLSFYTYHRLVISPLETELSHLSKRTWRIINATHLQTKIFQLEQGERTAQNAETKW